MECESKSMFELKLRYLCKFFFSESNIFMKEAEDKIFLNWIFVSLRVIVEMSEIKTRVCLFYYMGLDWVRVIKKSKLYALLTLPGDIQRFFRTFTWGYIFFFLIY